MSGVTLLIGITLFIPLALTGVGKFLCQFCEIRSDAVIALCFCVGGVFSLQNGVIASALKAVVLLYQAGATDIIMIHGLKFLSIIVYIGCGISILSLLIELPSRWVMRSNGIEVVPWSLVRTLLVVLCVSSTFSWLSDLLIRSL